MSDPGGDPAALADTTPEEVALPEPVRQRVIALVADELPTLAVEELPAELRSFARFTPSRRARLGGRAIATKLAADPLFRQRVAARVIASAGEFGSAVAGGVAPAAGDPVDVAAMAYLARPNGWLELLSAATSSLGNDGQASLRTQERAFERLTEQLERARSAAKADIAKLRAELQNARNEAEELRARAREVTKALRAAEQEAKRAQEALSTERGRAAAAASTQDAELRRLRSRLSDVESELDAAKRLGREGRSADEARLWLLLETISNAAQGLRRELALNPATQLPADLVAAALADAGAAQPGRPTWAASDPSRLDQLLTMPKAHLVVDGYNVTKTGFGEASLEQQRTRLVTRLGGLVAQTGAEVTVVFDGADRLPVAPTAPRGVRVLFSVRGQTADELIRRLVRAEPAGRPVIVVSADNEVADGARRAGAYPVPSQVLVDRLSRG